jgi:hypothetical protein
MPPTTIFTLASGRSGTHFLYELIRRNAMNCTARHETYGLNPSMFGRPIYDHATGSNDSIRALLTRKRRIVDGCRMEFYAETSHAFLKSWFHLATEYFPRLKLVHLIRDPLKVAKSEADREQIIKRLRVPFCHYRGGDGLRYFLWSLTGLEPIFQHFDPAQLSRLEWYLIQWIEIENRAMRFLDQFSKQAACYSMHSPVDLNDPARVAALFEFLGLTQRNKQIPLAGRRNKNWRATQITDDDRQQFHDIVQRIPSSHLEIFCREPYASLPWANTLVKF